MNYKTLGASLTLFTLATQTVTVSAMTTSETELQESASFLGEMGAIESQDSIFAYNLNSDITRREMLKVMMNISGKTVLDVCDGEFSDMDDSDWGCKYAESALAQGFIAQNTDFRPNDSISQAESLKMIMQAKGINRDENDDWRAGYESKAISEGILTSKINYDDQAQRGLIFNIAARSYSNFIDLITDKDSDISVEIGGSVMLDTKHMVENLSASSIHTTLVSALMSTGLDANLSTGGTFTVFAPTNTAFSLLPEGAVSSLMMSDNKEVLTDILTYHVVPGSFTSSSIRDGMELTTLNGKTLSFNVIDDITYINGEASITTSDARSSNGITHVIDTVLMP